MELSLHADETTCNGGRIGIGDALAGCTHRRCADVSSPTTTAHAPTPATSFRPSRSTRSTASTTARSCVIRPTRSPAPSSSIPAQKFLYFVLPDGKAVRYGIGVGREGFEWKGTARVALKREWPVWTPPAAMIRRQPELAKFARRHAARPHQRARRARALSLQQGRRHAATGCTARRNGRRSARRCRRAASGCMNQDIIDLYNRAEVGAKVIVR